MVFVLQRYQLANKAKKRCTTKEKLFYLAQKYN